MEDDEAEKTETFWVTSYAMTKGIVCFEARVFEGEYATGLWDGYKLFKKIGTEAFRTKEEAEVRARELIDAKLASIEKQTVKLEKLRTKLKYAKESK